MPWSESILHQIETRLSICVPNMRACFELSEQKLAEAAGLVKGVLTSEASFVVFGSLARKEYNESSDLDWSLLVDGRADAAHRATELKLQKVLAESGLFKDPNPSGAFGALVFSHDLIHRIGGMHDTNANLTRRLLLLLESAEPASQPTGPRERMIKGILTRYFEEEGFFPGKQEYFFPRFFMNDVVRLWRTIAVDFAAKNADRGAKGWALRSAKLRFSRKILYVAGLLLTYETRLFKGDESEEQSAVAPLSAAARCYLATQSTPLELLARAALNLAIPVDAVTTIFETYDQFLGLLCNTEKREKLSKLTFDQAENDTVFQGMRELGHQFQDALDRVFVRGDNPVSQLTLKYGLF